MALTKRFGISNKSKRFGALPASREPRVIPRSEQQARPRVARVQPETARDRRRHPAHQASLDTRIAKYIARLTEKIEAVAPGLALQRRTEFEKLESSLTELGEKAPPWTTRLPSFDPRSNHLLPTESFWLCLEQKRTMVGCIAVKLVRSSNLKRDVDTLRIWYDRGGAPEFDITALDYHVLDGLSGVWSLGGKLWLDKSMRRTGLSTWLTVLIRAQMLTEHRTEGHFCLLKDTIAQHGLDRKSYLYPRAAEPALMLRSHRYGDTLNMSTNAIHRREIVEEIEEAIDA